MPLAPLVQKTRPLASAGFTQARREAGRVPEKLPGLDLADVESRQRDGETVVGGQGHGAAGVGLAAEFPATRVVLAVFQPDLDPVSAVAAHDQEIRPDAEAVVSPGLPLPKELAVGGRNATQVASVFIITTNPPSHIAEWM